MSGTRLCIVGDSSSIHVRRWAEHFSRDNELLVVSDSPDRIDGVSVQQVFTKRAGMRNLFRIPRLRRIVRKFSPDIVHGHYLTVGGFYAAFSGAQRVVCSAWGSDVYQGPEQSLMERLALKSVLKRCDLVFAVTKDVAARVRAFGYEGEVQIFRWGADPEVFRRTSHHGTTEFRILSLRSCDRIYNPAVILGAFKAVMPQMPEAVLYFFDFGNVVGMIHEIVDADPELGKKVRFIGRRPHSAMPEVYNSVDVAVSIPDTDGAPASVIESMACEVPVIATDVPNLREWIDDGVEGYLTAVSVPALSTKIMMAYSSRMHLIEMGKRARARILDDANQGTFASNARVAEAAYKKLLS